MKELETEINYAGHYLKQIWREKDVAVYARSLTPKREPHELELIFVQTRPESKMTDGRVIPVHEAYPSPSEWGNKGFSFPIRHKDAVLALAEEGAGILEGRAALVRARRKAM